MQRRREVSDAEVLYHLVLPFTLRRNAPNRRYGKLDYPEPCPRIRDGSGQHALLNQRKSVPSQCGDSCALCTSPGGSLAAALCGSYARFPGLINKKADPAPNKAGFFMA